MDEARGDKMHDLQDVTCANVSVLPQNFKHFSVR
jgi:hypothetical protein